MDRTQIAEEYKKHKKPLRNWLAFRMKQSRNDAEDHVQEVFIRLMKYSDATEVENVQGYLHRIATNVTLESMERARSRLLHSPELLEDIESPRSVDDDIESEQLEKKVHQVMATLTPRQRDILCLHAFDRLTYNDIARRKNVSYRIVLRDITRAYEAFRANPSLRDLLLTD